MTCRSFTSQRGLSLVRILIILLVFAIVVFYLLPYFGAGSGIIEVFNRLSSKAKAIVNGLLAKVAAVKSSLGVKMGRFGEKIDDLEVELLCRKLGIESFCPPGEVIYKITEKVLKTLEDQGVPTRIRELLGEEFTNKKDFLKAVEQEIGKEDTNKYEKILLKHARDASRARSLRAIWQEDLETLIYFARQNGYNMRPVEILLDQYRSGTVTLAEVETEFWVQIQNQTADVINTNINRFRMRTLGCSDFAVELTKIWNMSQRFNEETLEGYFEAKRLSEELDDSRSLEFAQDIFGWLGCPQCYELNKDLTDLLQQLSDAITKIVVFKLTNNTFNELAKEKRLKDQDLNTSLCVLTEMEDAFIKLRSLDGEYEGEDEFLNALGNAFSYKLTGQTLEQLKNEGVPEEIVSKLDDLKEPNVGFTLNEQSFKNLRREQIPDNILDTLTSLQCMRPKTKEALWENIELRVGAEQVAEYKTLFLDQVKEENISFTEQQFLNAVAQKIGQDQTDKYKKSLLKYAKDAITPAQVAKFGFLVLEYAEKIERNPDYPRIIEQIDKWVNTRPTSPFKQVLGDITVGEIYLSHALINPAEARFDQAIRNLSDVLNQSGGSIPPDALTRLHMALGLLNERVCKNNDLAVKEFKDVVACAKRAGLECELYNSAHFHLGIINLKLREAPQFRSEFEEKGSSQSGRIHEIYPADATPVPVPTATPQPTPTPNPLKITIEIPLSRTLKAKEKIARSMPGVTKGDIVMPRPVRLMPRQELGESQQMKQFRIEDLYDLSQIPSDAAREFETYLKCTNEGTQATVARFIHDKYLGK